MSIYFMQSGQSGPIKIGWSTDPEERLRKLQPGSFEPLRMVLLLSREQREERMMHLRFAEDRLRGDWYWPSKKLVSEIEKMGGKAAVAQGGGPGEIRRLVKKGQRVSLTTIQEQMRDIRRSGGSDDHIDCYALIRWEIGENTQALSESEQKLAAESLQDAAGSCAARCAAGGAESKVVGVIVQIPTRRTLDSIAKGIKETSAQLIAGRCARLRDVRFYSKLWSNETQYFHVAPEDDISYLLRTPSWF